MNKPLRRIAIFCGLLVLTLLIRDNWLQYAKADSLKNDELNRRVTIARYSVPRGDIIVGGSPITGSVETKSNGLNDLKYKRTYKDGPMWAPVTGYASQSFGATQLESIDDGILTGNDDRLFFRNTLDMLTGKPKQGGNVVTTLNAAAQKAAYNGLKDRGKGAVVALEPSTGKILALASFPSYDPSSFAGASSADGKGWNKVQKKTDPNDPTLNRALRETYPPGSTFKVVTAAAALENGLYTSAEQHTESPDPWIMPGTTTPLPNEGSIPCKNATMREALRWSCNTVFGKIGATLGNEKMLDEAKKFGFDSEQFTPVRSNASVFSDKMAPSEVAQSSIGQFNTAATPLQMAMVVSAVANDGKLMKPYMVDKLTSPNLDTLEQTQPEQMSQPLSSKNAQILQSMMETVVTDGTGKNARIGGGVTVGGKTGTAQHGVNNSEKPYAWFISYAKTSDGSSPVAVAVVVEDNSANRDDISGGGLAAPIAKSVMEAVINSKK
ncbi:penicillin-binding transpeptidase domain-containing protein [Streptomyces similanensis]|uniref:Penicillin-binding transpeptidase domain-containing protein n=1 Tax=Streptomyces similanensis TaxID=1274988 RepID=A0ABP9K356_9ACTN